MVELEGIVPDRHEGVAVVVTACRGPSRQRISVTQGFLVSVIDGVELGTLGGSRKDRDGDRPRRIVDRRIAVRGSRRRVRPSSAIVGVTRIGVRVRERIAGVVTGDGDGSMRAIVVASLASFGAMPRRRGMGKGTGIVFVSAMVTVVIVSSGVRHHGESSDDPTVAPT